MRATCALQPLPHQVEGHARWAVPTGHERSRPAPVWSPPRVDLRPCRVSPAANLVVQLSQIQVGSLFFGHRDGSPGKKTEFKEFIIVDRPLAANEDVAIANDRCAGPKASWYVAERSRHRRRENSGPGPAIHPAPCLDPGPPQRSVDPRNGAASRDEPGKVSGKPARRGPPDPLR